MAKNAEPTTEFEHDPVTAKQYFGYNLGALPGSFFGSFMGQVQAFYFKWLGLGWGWIVLAQILFAIWNTTNDPLFGLLQNRTRTKNGRYIPWIKWSAPFFSVAFIIVFFPPDTWSSYVSGAAYQFPLFIWYLGSQCLYDTFFTIIYIAHVSLLPQMTFAMTERTKISVLYAILSLIGGLASGVLPLIFLTNPTNDSIFSFKIMVVIFAVLAYIPWILLVRWVKERQEFLIPKENEESMATMIKYVFKNPSGRIYILYDGISVGIMNILLTALTFMFEWLLGLVSGYPKWDNNWGIINIIPEILMIVIGAVAGAIVQLQIPKKYDIKTAIEVGLIFQAIGFFIAFLGAMPNPNAPHGIYSLPNNIFLMGIGLGIGFFGLVTDIIYHNPMRGDTIDYDESTTGERHESIYAGIGCIFSKPMISVALAIVPTIISLYGLVSANPSDPTSTRLWVPSGDYGSAVMGVAVAALLIPSILAMIGAIIWRFYPLTRNKLVEMHSVLEKMHAQKRAERLNADGQSIYISNKDDSNLTERSRLSGTASKPSRPETEQERFDRLGNNFKFTAQMEIPQIAQVLKMGEDQVTVYLVSHMEQIKFKIKGNKVIFKPGDVNAFLEWLKKEFTGRNQTSAE